MSPLWVNVTKVVFVAALYLFLWFVARSIGAHLSAPPAPRPGAGTHRRPTGVVLAISGAGGTRHVEVRDSVVVGRGAVDVVVDDPFASDRHLRIDVEGDRVTVVDLGSTNGTVINDIVIHVPTVVQRGDVIRVGTTTLEVQ
jgi:hypothetical protein